MLSSLRTGDTAGKMPVRGNDIEVPSRSLSFLQKGIAFSGTVGAGLFVTSGQLITISGSLGYVIAYIAAALIVTGVMRSLAEMVSVRPVSGALIDFPHTYVDPALGFAVGVTYWFVPKTNNCIDAADIDPQRLSQCFSMATITSSAARAANSFSDDTSLDKKVIVAIIVGLFLITLLSNLCGVKVGEVLALCDSYSALTGNSSMAISSGSLSGSNCSFSSRCGYR
jgi:amino acid transporter